MNLTEKPLKLSHQNVFIFVNTKIILLCYFNIIFKYFKHLILFRYYFIFFHFVLFFIKKKKQIVAKILKSIKKNYIKLIYFMSF